MCGIIGFIDASCQMQDDKLKDISARMVNTLQHRGPDDIGVWVSAESGVALGHRRLSIIDLSSEGHQPMCSACGRYVIVFNGEIYNLYFIKLELEKAGFVSKWRGHSDTEILLAAIGAWGITNSLKKIRGMFAFALWDTKEQNLYLCKDRIGEKPLYYGLANKVFIFGSELKALHGHPDFQPEVDRDALMLYLRYCYVPSPYSIYKNIFKLMPGTVLKLTKQDVRKGCLSSPSSYWSIRSVVESSVSDQFGGSDTDAAKILDNLLRESVCQQMISDVPLGAFLSGGIDSSTIVALMQSVSANSVKTFTIGFEESNYNEAVYAKAVAEYLKTDHTELYVTPQEALDVIPKLPVFYDEPFADSSQIPTFLVAQLARRYVTVSLSGDGGDELFGGYNRYFWSRSVWDKVKYIPFCFRDGVSKMLTGISPSGWDLVFDKLKVILPSRFIQQSPGDKIHKLADIIRVNSIDKMYYNLVSTWKNPKEVVVSGNEWEAFMAGEDIKTEDNICRMMYLDLVSYLPDDILVKVDRASMGVSLESRMPMLDHKIVEFALRLPMSMKVRNGSGKWVLRQVLYKYVPEKIVERPKMGFGVPIDSWLRGPLRNWAEDLLDEGRLEREGYFNPKPIREKWIEHLSGKRNWQHYLWSILMFQSWQEKWC